MKKYSIIFGIFLILWANCLWAQTNTDTFRIQDFPLKIYRGEERVKKLNTLGPTLLARNDWQIRQDWKSYKTIQGAGLGIQAVGVGLMGYSLLKTVKGESGSSLLLGGTAISLGGVIVQVLGVSKAKAALRRYNSIQVGRQDAIPIKPKPEVLQNEPVTLDKPIKTRAEPAAKPPREETPQKPAPRLFPNQPLRTTFFFNGDSLANLKPTPNDIGFGIKAEGLRGMFWENNFDSLTLQFRKVKDPKTVWRGDLSIGFSSLKTSDKTVFETGGYNYDENSERQLTIGVVPAIERHFQGTRRLDPYVGAGLPIVLVGKRRTIEIDDDVNSDGTYFKKEETNTQPGGFGIGVDGFLGLNYFVADRISIGLEYTLGLSVIRFNGKFKYKRITRVKTSPTGPENKEIVENDGDEIGFTSTSFGNKGVAGLNLIFYLGDK